MPVGSDEEDELEEEEKPKKAPAKKKAKAEPKAKPASKQKAGLLFSTVLFISFKHENLQADVEMADVDSPEEGTSTKKRKVSHRSAVVRCTFILTDIACGSEG